MMDVKEITRHLNAWQHGDPQALDRVMPLIYGQLKKLAAVFMQGELPGHGLQPTALVHEAFIRLTENHPIDWRSRAHFLAIAGTTMRRILIDDARQRETVKHGGQLRQVPFEETFELKAPYGPRLLALEEALERLTGIDPLQGRLVEMRFFAGMTHGEISEVLGVTERTVKRRWRTAKIWLFHHLTQGTHSEI